MVKLDWVLVFDCDFGTFSLTLWMWWLLRFKSTTNFNVKGVPSIIDLLSRSHCSLVRQQIMYIFRVKYPSDCMISLCWVREGSKVFLFVWVFPLTDSLHNPNLDKGFGQEPIRYLLLHEEYNELVLKKTWQRFVYSLLVY